MSYDNIKINYCDVSTGNIYDITSYVISCDDIPIYERNITWEPLISEFNMEISQAFLIALDKDDTITISFDATHNYKYIISMIETDYKNRSYNVSIKNNLYLLQNTLINDTNLGHLLTGSADVNKYKYNDFYILEAVNPVNPVPNYKLIITSNVQLLWALECMFSASGLKLYTSNVTSSNLGTFFVGGYTAEERTIYASDLKVDYQQLLTFGTGWTKSSNSYAQDDLARKSCWDYVKEVASLLGFGIINETTSSYKLLPMYDYNNDIINDSYNYNYSVKEYEHSYDKSIYTVNLEWKRTECYQNGFTFIHNPNDTTIHEYDYQYANRDDTANYEFPYNFRFLIRDKHAPVDSGSVVPGDQDNAGLWWRWFYPYGVAYGLNRQTMRYSNRNDYSIEKIETDINLNVNKKYLTLKVDLENRISKIEQETFIYRD